MQSVTIELNEVTAGLAEDLKALRAGKITNADGRVRAQLGREILRGFHLDLEGLKFVTASAKAVERLEGKTAEAQEFDDDGKPANGTTDDDREAAARRRAQELSP